MAQIHLSTGQKPELKKMVQVWPKCFKVWSKAMARPTWVLKRCKLQNEDVPSLKSNYGHNTNFGTRRSSYLLMTKYLPRRIKTTSLYKQWKDDNDQECLENGSLSLEQVIKKHAKSRTMETPIPNSTLVLSLLDDHTLMTRLEEE